MRNAWGGQPKRDIPKPAKTDHSAPDGLSSKDQKAAPSAGTKAIEPHSGEAVPPSGAQKQQQQRSEFDSELDKHLDGISSVLGGIHAR